MARVQFKPHVDYVVTLLEWLLAMFLSLLDIKQIVNLLKVVLSSGSGMMSLPRR